MSPHREVKLTALELVYPPISIQEAVWIERENDVSVEEILRTSDFYMIVGRADAIYRDFDLDGSDLHFGIQVGASGVFPAKIDLDRLSWRRMKSRRRRFSSNSGTR